MENEFDLMDGHPIDHPIDRRLLTLPSAPSNHTTTDTPDPTRKRGREPEKQPRMTAKRKCDRKGSGGAYRAWRGWGT